jgi:hypothetical protein
MPTAWDCASGRSCGPYDDEDALSASSPSPTALWAADIKKAAAGRPRHSRRRPARLPLLPQSDPCRALLYTSGAPALSRMAGFTYRLELEDGTPADPPTFETATPTWGIGDTIPLGRRLLRVVRVRDDDADQPPVLIVEDVAG